MITYQTKNFNVNINEYYKYITNLELSTLKCPNCANHNFERHGYYNRYIINNNDKKRINIVSVKNNMG